MLHILWMLIKFILIVSGILLGLVLLAILLLLFDPVRYRAQVKKDAQGFKTLTAEARVSWLFGLISLRAAYADEKPDIAVRIFGISAGKLKGLLNHKKNASSPSASPKKAKDGQHAKEPSAPIPPQQDEDSRTENTPEPEMLLKADSAGNEDPQLEAFPADAQVEAPPAPGLFSRIWGTLKILPGLLVRAVRFLFSLPGKIAAVFQKIRTAIQGICDKINWWIEFLEDEHTREVFRLVRQQAAGLNRHMLPTKVSGEVTFGCEDPSLTGKILAVLGMSFPLHKNRIAVTPLFDGENRLTGSVFLKGRIYGIAVLAAALKIYFNRNTKYVISQWKSKA